MVWHVKNFGCNTVQVTSCVSLQGVIKILLFVIMIYDQKKYVHANPYQMYINHWDFSAFAVY